MRAAAVDAPSLRYTLKFRLPILRGTLKIGSNKGAEAPPCGKRSA